MFFLVVSLALAGDPCAVMAPVKDAFGGRKWENYASNSYPLQRLIVSQGDGVATLTVGFAQVGITGTDLPAGALVEVALDGGVTTKLVTPTATPVTALVSGGGVGSEWLVRFPLSPETLRALSGSVLGFRTEIAGANVTVSLNPFAQRKLASALACIAATPAGSP